MKLTAILLTAACLQMAAAGKAQRISLNLKDAPLRTVFLELNKQTGYNFLYSDEVLSGTKAVTIKVKDALIEEVLRLAFKDQSLDYQISNNSIVVKRAVVTESTIQELPKVPPPIDVKGRIVNENGEGVIATITVKGTKKAVTSDENGFFILKGLDENATLVITAANIESREVAVNGKNDLAVLHVKMKVGAMEEVIINKGYYTEKQRNTVGNVTTVTAKDIEKQPVQNPLLALQGRVPGLEITQLTGMNGGGVKVQIQGRNSINNGLEPLIVVDGVPYLSSFAGITGGAEDIIKGGSPLNYINPGDIESIDVLKDADATAIYGSRAANGAILITTKKGKAGIPKLSLSIQQGWSKVSQYVDMLNTRQYLDMRYEALNNSNINWRSSSVSANDLKIWDTTRYTNWQKELLGASAQYTNINASFSGGTQLMQYMISGTYNRRTTVFSGNKDNKLGAFHFNLGAGTANQRLKVQLTGSYTYDQNELPGSDLTQAALLLEPNAPSLYNPDGSINWAPNAAGSSTWQNPLTYTTSFEFNSSTRTLVSNILLNYRIVKGLDFRTSLGYTNMQAGIFRPARLEFFAPEIRAFVPRSAIYGNRNTNTWIIEPQLVYTNTWGQSKIDGMVATTIQKSSYEYLDIEGIGYPSDELLKTMLAAQTITINSSVFGTSRYNALFGRFNYTYANRYIVNFTARRDGSNRFGDNNKFSNFWSAGAAWIFSDERFIQKRLPFLSFGKLRASYGITGNDQIPDFSYLSIYNIYSSSLLYQNTLSFLSFNIPNPYLQWEVTRKLQAGIDLGFLKDRINLGITYARNRSSNQLVNYSVPSITGSDSYPKNLPALIQNSSWEFVLNTLNVKRRSFSWNTSANLTIPRNKLLSFPGIEKTAYSNLGDGVDIGQPLGVLYLPIYAGMSPLNGRYLLMDQNGNASTAGGGQRKFVSVNTIYYAGLSNSFSYKGFQLDIFFQFVRKIGPRDFYWSNGTTYPGVFSAGNSNQPVSVLNRWQKPGDNTLVSPFYSSTPSLGSSMTGRDAYYDYDASFIRLKNIALSWQLPTAFAKKAGAQNAKLYCNAQNLHVFTKYKGMDPESGATSLPPLQTIIIGAQVEF